MLPQKKKIKLSCGSSSVIILSPLERVDLSNTTWSTSLRSLSSSKLLKSTQSSVTSLPTYKAKRLMRRVSPFMIFIFILAFVYFPLSLFLIDPLSLPVFPNFLSSLPSLSLFHCSSPIFIIVSGNSRNIEKIER